MCPREIWVTFARQADSKHSVCLFLPFAMMYYSIVVPSHVRVKLYDDVT